MQVRRLSAAAAVAMATMGLILVGQAAGSAATEDAPEEGSCPVVAAAQGVQVMISASDNLVLQAPSGAGIPAAQACVDYAVNDSSGYAGAPYPGETIVSAPALLRGTTGQPVPDYPAYAASRYPSSEESTVSGQGYSLSSRSSENASKASARVAVGADPASAASTLASATTVVDPSARRSKAMATSHTQPLTIDDVLELGRVRSSATAEMHADGKLVRASRLQVGRTLVAGQAVEITPDGVRAADQTVDVPQTDPVSALEEAGIRVRYLEERKTSRGVLSAGIEVTARYQDPETGALYTTYYTFGRAFASAAAVEENPDGTDQRPPGSATGSTGDSGLSEVDEDQAAVQPDTGAAASGPAPADAPPPDGEAPQVADESQASPSLARFAGGAADMGLAGLYLVIVCGALAMFASGTLLRLLGVKTRWTP